MADTERRGMFGGLGERIAGGLVAGPVGLLMGPQAFQGMRDSRERRAQENMLMRDAIAAREEFTDLLGRQVEVPRGAPAVQQPQLFPNQAAPGPAPQASPVAGPGGFDTVPAYATPEGRQRVLELMARMSPEGAMKVAESIAGTGQRTNSMKQRISALIEWGEQQGLQGQALNDFVNANLGGGTNDPSGLLAAAILQQRQAAADAAQREEAAATERERVDRLTRESSLNSTLRGIEDLATNNQFLSSTFMRPGWGAETRRAGLAGWEFVKSLAGGDTSKERLLLQTYGDFEKGAANLLNDLLPTLRGINANTDNRLDQIKKSLADVGNEPGTNAKILSETIYDILEIAEINRFKIPQIETWRGLADNLRYFNKSGGALYQEGQTATNPETGEQLIFHNGGWKRPDEIGN